MDNQNVSLTIYKEIVQPIVQAKINEAILAAMGGQDALIEKTVNVILNQKVNKDGSISPYSSDNNNTWMNVVITKQIGEAVKAAMKELLATKQDQIKAAIMKQLTSKRSIESFAAALLDNAAKVQDRYYSTVKVELHEKNY